MPRVERKYALDSNLFIDGLRQENAKLELLRFHALFAPFEYLSAVVVQELLAGTRSVADQRARRVSAEQPAGGQSCAPEGFDPAATTDRRGSSMDAADNPE